MAAPYPITAGVRFKDIPGFPYYRIGDDGTPQSRRGYSGKIIPWYDMKVTMTPAGRRQVTFFKNGKNHRRAIAPLVLEAFIGPRPAGMLCCHNDGNRANDHLSNLRWATHRENMRDRELHGKTCRGSRNAAAKLNEAQVAEIRARIRVGEPQVSLAAIYGISVCTISEIKRKVKWKHVPDPSERGA